MAPIAVARGVQPFLAPQWTSAALRRGKRLRYWLRQWGAPCAEPRALLARRIVAALLDDAPAAVSLEALVALVWKAEGNLTART